MKKLYPFIVGFFLVQLGSCIFISFANRPSHARLAAQYRSEKKYAEAIGEYQQHITARLEDSRREPEENPYFYLILIGDVYLEQTKLQPALESYIEAKEREVETPLVVDRIRRVARALRDNGQHREAVTLLKKYRALDEFVFDLDIDETLKAIVTFEDKR